jgi:2-polyprenyl-3-methyl-5-hydroxy-6-metoxy-1,4-benzoquinol methylase
MNDSSKETEAERLRRFWNTRYQDFSLQESGIKTLSNDYIQLLYRCKLEAWVNALSRSGLRQRTGLRVLDAGCGQGFFADAVERELTAAHYTGVDISEKSIAHLRETRPQHSWICDDFANRDFSLAQSFDLIQSIEVIHLILDDANHAMALSNFAKLLAKNGRIVVTDMLPKVRTQINPYIIFRPLTQYQALADRLGLVIESVRPIYYFVPSRGWTASPVNKVFARLSPQTVFALDRAALAMRLPHFWTTHDSQVKMLVLRAA